MLGNNPYNIPSFIEICDCIELWELQSENSYFWPAAIYLDPLKSGLPDHFCLKFLDPLWNILSPHLKPISITLHVIFQNFQLNIQSLHINSLMHIKILFLQKTSFVKFVSTLKCPYIWPPNVCARLHVAINLKIFQLFGPALHAQRFWQRYIVLS